MWLSLLVLLPSRDPSTTSPFASEEAVLPLGRVMLLRIVTEAGRCSPAVESVRGEPVGVRVPGAGSFERAECTRSSIFCMRPLSALIWYSESDLTRPSAGPVLGRETVRPFEAGGFIA